MSAFGPPSSGLSHSRTREDGGCPVSPPPSAEAAMLRELAEGAAVVAASALHVALVLLDHLIQRRVPTP